MNLSLLADVQSTRYDRCNQSYNDPTTHTDRWLTPEVDEWAPDRILRRIAAAVAQRAEAAGESPDDSWWVSAAETTFYTVDAIADAVAITTWPDEVLSRIDVIGATLDAIETERKPVTA